MRQLTSDSARQVLEDAISGLHLLTHPFYRRWEAGELGPGEVASYCGQYRHFERMIPGLLAGMIAATDDAVASEMLSRNLADEAGGPLTHLELFDGFAMTAGAPSDEPAEPATAALVDTYGELAASSPLEGLAALGAYELQSPAIATSKSTALVDLYGFAPDSVRFWDLHATVDGDHATWVAAAMAALDDGSGRADLAARRAAEAWWGFLDERQAAAPVAA